jgi:PBP1b-binding outer membrane lipoprotein LpoB
MKTLTILSLLMLALLMSACKTTAMTYAEWKEKTHLEAEAKKKGVPYEYKTRAQIRKEAEDMRAIMGETVNSMVKPTAK